MKRLLFVLLTVSLLTLFAGMSARAQNPNFGTLVYVGGYGTPLSTAAPMYLPTQGGVWPEPTRFVPPPTWTPYVSPTPQGQYQARVTGYAIVYKIPARLIFVPISVILPGEVLSVSDYDANWVYIRDGWAAGFYIEKFLTLRL